MAKGTKGGRPTSLTDDLLARIVKKVEKLCDPKQATLSEGVPRSTYYDWAKTERFSDAIARAEAVAEVDAVLAMRDPPMDSHGKADAGWLRTMGWLLERLRRERFGQRIELVAQEKAASVLIARLREGLDPAEFATVLDVLLEEGGEDREGEAGGDAAERVH